MKSIRPGNTFVVRKLRLGVGLDLKFNLKLVDSDSPGSLPG